MFLLIINDLPLYTKPVNTDMYADDTTLYEIGISQAEIERNLQLALNNLSKWCKANDIVINTAKTKLMLITTNQRRTFLRFLITDKMAILENKLCHFSFYLLHLMPCHLQ